MRFLCLVYYADKTTSTARNASTDHVLLHRITTLATDFLWLHTPQAGKISSDISITKTETRTETLAFSKTDILPKV